MGASGFLSSGKTLYAHNICSIIFIEFMEQISYVMFARIE